MCIEMWIDRCMDMCRDGVREKDRDRNSTETCCGDRLRRQVQRQVQGQVLLIGVETVRPVHFEESLSIGTPFTDCILAVNCAHGMFIDTTTTVSLA